MPSAIETLVAYANAQGWRFPAYWSDLLWDVIEDMEDGKLFSFWELVYALLKHNDELGWYDKYSIPHFFRPRIVWAYAEYQWWNHSDCSGYIYLFTDQYGLDHFREVLP